MSAVLIQVSRPPPTIRAADIISRRRSTIWSGHGLRNRIRKRKRLILSWVQVWRWSLSPPEVATSRLPGLNCYNTTHLPPLTLPAIPHHHGLFIHHTPAALSGWIVCICIHVYMLFCVLWFTNHSVPCSLGHQHCVAVCGVPLCWYQHCVAVCGVPLCFLFCFLSVGLFVV